MSLLGRKLQVVALNGANMRLIEDDLYIQSTRIDSVFCLFAPHLFFLGIFKFKPKHSFQWLSLLLKGENKKKPQSSAVKECLKDIWQLEVLYSIK